MTKYSILILFFITISCSKLQGQLFDESYFTLYTTKEGLSNNRVTDITQDRFGYMWISTREGLNRFDGSTFQTFYADTSRNSLPRDELIKLRWLDSERLAASTIGMHIVNATTLSSTNIIIPPGKLKYEYKVNSMQDMLGDSLGNVFILTRSGFYQYNNKEQLVFRYDYYNESQQKEVFQFGRNMIKAGNSILLATYDGLFIYNISKKEIHPIGINDDTFFQQIAKPKEWFRFMHGNDHSFSVQMENATDLFFYDIDSKRKLLICSPFTTNDKFDWRSKLFKLNDSTYAINCMRRGFYLMHFQKETGNFLIEPKLYFENYFCSSLFLDKDSRLWVATNKGLFAEKKMSGNIESFTIPHEFNLFNKDLAISSLTIANEKIFVATVSGMLVFDRRNFRPIKRIPFFDPEGSSVYHCITISTDTVFATANCLAWVNTKNLKYGKIDLPAENANRIEPLALFKDSRNAVYLSHNNATGFYYRPTPSSDFQLLKFESDKFFNILVPIHIAEDLQGNIWFGGNGYSRFNVRSKQFDFTIDSFPTFKMARKEVCRPVFFESKVYFGIPENGLVMYNLSTKQFEQYTRNNGLPNNTVEALFQFHNKIWLGTDNGLASFDLTTRNISVFGVRDNLPPEPFTCFSFYFDSTHQQVYAGFNNTIVRFDPDKLIKNNSPPDFFIESIRIASGDVLFHPGKKISVSHTQNNLVISLASVNYEDAYQQQFAYRFADNGNEEWQSTGSQRSIILSNLSPGNHKLEVKVFIKNNSWPGQVRGLIIYVRPPFWKTTWFILLLTSALLITFYFLYRSHIRSVKQKINIDKQLAELEMKGLHAQMNPHFIFNSLNSIKEMILEDQRQNASRYLSKFAQLIRTSLEQSRHTFITVKQCIDHLHQYLEMEKIRFGEFQYSIHVEDSLFTEDCYIAPMLIQPLVENAIWHGLHNKKGERKLSIRFYRSNEELICEIDDNGIGIKQSKENKSGFRSVHRSLGIANIQERLSVLNEKYKINCSLTIMDKAELFRGKETGTLAVLRLTI